GQQVSDPENPFEELVNESSSTTFFDEVKLLEYPVFCHVASNYLDPPGFAYIYYINVKDSLIVIEFDALDNSPETREKFDQLISTFQLK
ncbi:MAG: hypothetical protein LBV12_11445, partial [Puniceicoccales bacterium]|nr:hypothetical protein [Puniceicoccales bacterium]